MTDQPQPPRPCNMPLTHPVDTIEQLALVCGGSPTSFTGQLLHLIAKADPQNRAKLRAGFPYEVACWEAWNDAASWTSGGEGRPPLAGDVVQAAMLISTPTTPTTPAAWEDDEDDLPQQISGRRHPGWLLITIQPLNIDAMNVKLETDFLNESAIRALLYKTLIKFDEVSE